ncbi:MAG: hypothetical protein WC840_01440 [Candidatus Peribacteraceae bacterium]
MATYRKLTVNAKFSEPPIVSKLFEGTLSGTDYLGQFGYDRTEKPTPDTVLAVVRISDRSIQRVRAQIEANFRQAGATDISFEEEPLESVTT